MPVFQFKRKLKTLSRFCNSPPLMLKWVTPPGPDVLKGTSSCLNLQGDYAKKSSAVQKYSPSFNFSTFFLVGLHFIEIWCTNLHKISHNIEVCVGGWVYVYLQIKKKNGKSCDCISLHPSVAVKCDQTSHDSLKVVSLCVVKESRDHDIQYLFLDEPQSLLDYIYKQTASWRSLSDQNKVFRVKQSGKLLFQQIIIMKRTWHNRDSNKIR